MSRADAAKIGGMERQTLRDWVHRFNEDGPDGLTNGMSARPRHAKQDERIIKAFKKTSPTRLQRT